MDKEFETLDDSEIAELSERASAAKKQYDDSDVTGRDLGIALLGHEFWYSTENYWWANSSAANVVTMIREMLREAAVARAEAKSSKRTTPTEAYYLRYCRRAEKERGTEFAAPLDADMPDNADRHCPWYQGEASK